VTRHRVQHGSSKFLMATLVLLVHVLLVGRAPAEVPLIGAGATFPSALYARWLTLYAAADPCAHIEYQAIGSGGGMKRLMEQSVAFGASDAPMTDEQMRAAKGGAILHVPSVLGAVVLVYNLAQGTSGLKLAPETIAGIFLGAITQWNDPQLTRLNPNLHLPNQAITVVHRSDGSGTTQIFSDYLSKVSPEWKKRVGQGATVIWPTGIAAKRNEAAAELVKRTPGAISYVEHTYALQSQVPYAWVQNRSGKFIEPTLASVSAAAKTMAGQADDFRVSLTDPAGSDAYPIAAFTWFLVYKNQSNKDQGQKLVNFLWWMMHEGQKEAPALHYVPLPKEVVLRGEQGLTEVTYAGQPLLIKK
jgi:phosphate transport system substrate-binding protein